MTSETPNAKDDSAKQFYEAIQAAIIIDDLEEVQSLLQRWQLDALSQGPTLMNLQLLVVHAGQLDRRTIFGYLFNQGRGIIDPAELDPAPLTWDYQDYCWKIGGKHRLSMLSILLVYTPVLRWYLAHGADPNISDRYGVSLLDQAVMWSPLDIVQLLLSYGAKNMHRQILYRATQRSTDRIAVLLCLLDRLHKPDIYAIAPDSPRLSEAQSPCQNGTALHSAAKAEDTKNTESLLMRGEYKESKTEEGLTSGECAENLQKTEVTDLSKHDERC
ncbi:hypothetical protein MMC07_005803 [Pseudocyphellaria aurata]|nr:hypothetical protein [Pseudocyphellaria aurata]